MAAEPLNEPDLTALLSDAKTDYEANWKVVDDELYELCSRRGRHDDFNDVYPKVAIVGRVYMAGVSRAWGGERDPDHNPEAETDPEAETARALIEEEQAGLIEEGLQRLEGHPFNQQVAGEIVELHRDVTKAISHRSVHSLTSFVSKYLHFHSRIVPIYDSRAEAAIGKLVDRRSPSVREARTALPKELATYRSFVAAFVVLHEQATKTGLKPTVKELDHLLWRLSSVPGPVSGRCGPAYSCP
jgi:hypothetical protein